MLLNTLYKGKNLWYHDEWGRVQYTKEMKLDEEGCPKWKVEKLDIDLYTSNIRRFGLWYEDLQNIGEAISALETK